LTCFPSHPRRGLWHVRYRSHPQIGSRSVRLPPRLGGAPQQRSQHVHAGQTESRCPLGQKRMSVEVQGKVTCDLFLVERRPLVIPGADSEPRSRSEPYTHTHSPQTLAETCVPKAYYVPSRIELVRIRLRYFSLDSERPPKHTPSPKSQSNEHSSQKRHSSPALICSGC